jgi:hypothetical protein
MLDFHKALRAPRQMNIEKVKAALHLGLSNFFVEVYKVLRMLRKKRPRHPKSCACHNIHMSQIKPHDSFTMFHITRFARIVQVHKIQRLLRKNTPKAPLILTHALPTFSNLQKVPRVPRT